VRDRNQILDAARHHHAAGRAEQAEALYRDLLEAEPRDAEAMMGLGVLALQRKDQATADRLLGSAASLAPDSALIAGSLAMAHRMAERWDDAEHCLRHALALDPTETGHAVQLATLFAQRDRPEDARSLLEQVLTHDPEHVDALFALATVLTTLDERDAAKDRYRRVLALDPERTHAQNNLALLLVEDGAVAEAMALFDDLILKDPTNANTVVNAAQALLPLGRAEEAERLLRRALATQPRSPAIQDSLGHALMFQGRVADAIAAFSATVRIAPTEPAPYLNLAVALRHAGDAGAAVKALRRASGLGPAGGPFEALLGDSMLAAGTWEQAWPLLRPVEWRGRDAPVTPRFWHLAEPNRNSLAALRFLPADGAMPVIRVAPVFVDLFREVLGEHVPVEPLTDAAPGADAVTAPEILARHATSPEAVGVHPLPAEAAPTAISEPGRIVVIPAVDAAPEWVARGRVPAADLLQAVLQRSPREVCYIGGADNLPHRVRHLDPYETQPSAILRALRQADLVIGGDNALCHLAGLIGRPVHLLLPSFADGRWLASGERTVWYPTVRLHRQTVPLDWRGAIVDAVAAIVPGPRAGKEI